MNAITEIKPANVVNGIDLDAVTALVGGVVEDPAKAMTHWKVSSKWQGQTWSRHTVEGFDMGGEHYARPFTVDIDEPLELGGQNRFANPQEYLLAALNACLTVGYAVQCSLRGIVIESLEIETSGDIDLHGFFGLNPAVSPGYDTLDTVVRIKGSGTPEQFAEVHAAVQATSPNLHNITKAIADQPRLVVE